MKKTMRNLTMILLISILSLLLTACGGETENNKASNDEQKIVLTSVSSWDSGYIGNNFLWIFQEKVKELSNGRLEIKHLGGPEVAPQYEVASAVGSGSIDIGHTGHSSVQSQVPDKITPLLQAAILTKIEPWEERDKGVNDFYNKIYEENLNLHFLGRTSPNIHFKFYTNFPVNSIEDFKGKIIRISPSHRDFVEALGTSAVTMPGGEIYIGMERGTIDGFIWSDVGIKDAGWHEVTKFFIEPPFSQIENILVINKDAWDELPSDLQEVINEAMKQTEKLAAEYFSDEVSKERENLLSEGMVEAKLEGQEKEKFLKILDDTMWPDIIKNSGDQGQYLKDTLS